jgi:hypothetical protein
MAFDSHDKLREINIIINGFLDSMDSLDKDIEYGDKNKENDFGLQNLPQVCGASCFECPLNLNEITLSKDVIMTRKNIKVGAHNSSINESKYRMLCAFKHYKNKILSRQFLLEYTWGLDCHITNNVNVMVSTLRSLLNKSELEIVTIRKQGYLMTDRKS